MIARSIFILLLITSHVYAQYPVRVQVNIAQPVSPYLPQIKADIAGNRAGQLNQDVSSRLSILLNYTGQAQVHIKLAGSIERVSPSPLGVSLRPDYQPSRPIIMGLQQPMIQLTKDMLQTAFGNFSENSLVWSNMDLNTLRQNGVDYKLPEGVYRVCVTAYDYDKPGFSAPLSAPGTGCTYFTICYTASAPQLIQPVSTMLQSNSGFQELTMHSSQVQFIWTPPATTCGTPLGPLTYDLEIRQVFAGQTVTDAQYNPFVFRQQNIPVTQFFLDTLKYAHVLFPGQKYIVRVKANLLSMPGSPLQIANQGYSQIGAFAYQSAGGGGTVTLPPGGFTTSSYTPGGSCPATSTISNTTNLTGGLTGQDLTIDGFKLHVDQASANSDGSYTGNGYVIWHPFANDVRLKVNFGMLKVNTDKVVYSGDVHSSTDAGHPQWAPFGVTDPVASLTGLDNSDYESIKTRIGAAAYLVNQIAGTGEVDFPLGLNTTLGGAPVTMAIMGISFSPSCTNMNVLLNVNLPDVGGWLSLGGAGLQIAPQQLFLADKGGVLYLPKDRGLSLNGMKFTIDGCPNSGGTSVDTSKGTYVQWNGAAGLGKIMMNADLQIAGSSIVSVDKSDKRSSDPVTIHCKLGFSDWNDWVATGVPVNDFELAGLPGFPIHTDGLFYDHSARQNASGMSFPDGYTGAGDASFEGVYIPSLTMSLPGDFKTFSGSKAGGFGFTNFILDNTGVTTRITASNILKLSTGSLGGWAFSIDQINIGIVQDNFQDGMKMSGQLKLPISATALNYSCNLNSGEGKVNYQFVVNPAGDLDVSLWKAKISLEGNSSLVINNDAIGMAVKAHLNGGISVDITAGSNLPKVSLPGLDFQDMAMANRKDTLSSSAGFYFDPGKWSFAGVDLSKVAGGGGPPDVPFDGSSSQGSVAGFGISLSDFTPYFSPNSATQYEAGVYFNLNVNVGFGDASVVSGTTRLGILGKIDVPGNSAPSVAFDKIKIDSVALHGGIGPVTVNGSLWFIDNDSTYGDGVKGSLSADFPFASFSAAAQFGTAPNSVGGFHYWAVGGSVFLQAGVPIGPGLTVNGFGGGVYHNMSLSVPGDADIRSHSTTPGSIPMVPKSNTTGIQAQLIVAVIQPYVANASLTLSVEIHNGGLGLMELDGNGFVITDPPDNSDALASAYMKMKYDFENKVFDTYIDVQFHFLVASANAPLWMHGGPDGDYLYIGRPDQGDDKRISLELISIGKPGDVLYVDLGATAYFDAGTELPAFPPLPSEIGGRLDKGGSDNNVSSILQMLGKTGNAGFMFGAEAHGHIRLDLLFLYAQVDATLGFDVALMKVANPPAGCIQSDGSFGLNHWYAMGQIYAYFNLDVGLHVDLWFFSGDVELCKEEAWAVLQAGLPNPSWVDGEVHVTGSALGGVVSVSGDFPFSFGSQCTVTFNPLDNIQMITDAGPKDSAGVFDLPYAAFSVPVDGRDYPIMVPKDDKHDQPYTRTFRFEQYKFDLYKVKNGGDSLVAGDGVAGRATMSSDGLGSTLYHSSMMQAHSKYKIYIQCYVHEVVDGHSQDPAEGPKWQDTTVYFTTGPSPNHIVPENLAYSYPIAGQHYLLPNEFGHRGQIRMGEWQSDILPVSSGISVVGGYDYIINFIPEGGGDTLRTNFTMNQANNSLDYQLPTGFVNGKTYDMQVYVKPRGQMVELLSVDRQQLTQFERSQRDVQEINAQGQQVVGHLSNNINITTNRNIVKMAPKKSGGIVPIFTARFQVSQYNSFSDKVAALGQWTTEKEDALHRIMLKSGVQNVERFDEFDIKGYSSGCQFCVIGWQAVYPPLFSAVIPWDNNSQNDKFASDNLYANAFLLAVSGMRLDLGAPEVRDLMRPEYTVYTDGMPYDQRIPALSPLGIAVSGARATMNVPAGTGVQTMTAKGGSSGSSKGSSGSSSASPMFYTGGALMYLPTSYMTTNGKGQSQQPSSPPQMQLNTGNILLGGPVLRWEHDSYIYADYQLMQQFANNYLADQQNTTYLWGWGTIPRALAAAMAYGSDVSLATGEYGTISVSIDTYSGKWNDPTLTNLANKLKGIPFQPFPSTSGRTMQLKYMYPFCGNCGLGSTVPEKFNYGSGAIISPAPVMAKPRVR
ncbi:MAG TPA: hypothetical protein VHD83_06990 [Puia sp.]|nr:hypothetical protein [Puia sp.]